MDELVVSSVNEVPEPEELEEAGKLVEHFDCIEQLSKKLGKSVPTWDGLENFKSVYQEEQYELSAIETIDSAIDAGNWNESNYQTYSFSQLFLQPRPYTRRATSLISKPIPYSNWHPHNPHRMFEQCFARLQAEYKKKKIGIQGMYLEQGTMQALIELRFGGFLDSRQFVCSQKMLLIVQYGILEGVIMVAPHEDWFFTDATGDKKVDTTKESEYLVYRKLTTQTNIHLVQMSSQVNYQNPEHLSTLFNHFAKIQHIFDTPCKSCSKASPDGADDDKKGKDAKKDEAKSPSKPEPEVGQSVLQQASTQGTEIGTTGKPSPEAASPSTDSKERNLPSTINQAGRTRQLATSTFILAPLKKDKRERMMQGGQKKHDRLAEQVERRNEGKNLTPAGWNGIRSIKVTPKPAGFARLIHPSGMEEPAPRPRSHANEEPEKPPPKKGCCTIL
ncbi:unnamed protein product, partial [Mesorhabditis spiculigera]